MTTDITEAVPKRKTGRPSYDIRLHHLAFLLRRYGESPVRIGKLLGWTQAQASDKIGVIAARHDISLKDLPPVGGRDGEWPAETVEFARLLAELSAIGSVSKQYNVGFHAGIALVIADLARPGEHNNPKLAARLIAGFCITKEDFVEAGVDSYDLDVIKHLYRTESVLNAKGK